MLTPAPQVVSGMGSIDLSALTWEDYLLIGGGLAFAYSMWSDSKPKGRRKKSAGLSAGSSMSPGSIAFLALAAVAGYYVWTAVSPTLTSMAQTQAQLMGLNP